MAIGTAVSVLVRSDISATSDVTPALLQLTVGCVEDAAAECADAAECTTVATATVEMENKFVLGSTRSMPYLLHFSMTASTRAFNCLVLPLVLLFKVVEEEEEDEEEEESMQIRISGGEKLVIVVAVVVLVLCEALLLLLLLSLLRC